MSLLPRIEVAGFSEERLAAFRAHQRTAHDTLQAVAASLEVGETEREATRRIHAAFRARGVRRYFHVPVALFGERTAYPGDFGAFGALPTDTVLKPDMPVILDAAPVIDGHVVDVSLPVEFGTVPGYAELMAELRPFRERIPELLRSGASFREVARAVDRDIRARGLENCHRKHIGAVLGHRVTWAADHWLARRRVWGLGAWHAGWFVGRSLAAQRRGDTGSPNWNHGRESDHAPTDGLWAVEPHIARDGVGVKFEEILVIQDGEIFWLDENLYGRRG